MIGTIVKGIASFFSAGIGHKIGTVVSDGGIIIALTPVVIWLVTHKDEIAVSFTYGQLAVAGLVIAAIIKVAHVTRWGNPQNRNDFS